MVLLISTLFLNLCLYNHNHVYIDSVFELPVSGSKKLTTSEYCLPSDKYFHNWATVVSVCPTTSMSAYHYLVKQWQFHFPEMQEDLAHK